MKPFIIHISRRDDRDRWRVGFDCNDITFYYDVAVVSGDEEKLTIELSNGFIRAAMGMRRHFLLPKEDQERAIIRLKRSYASVEAR